VVLQAMALARLGRTVQADRLLVEATAASKPGSVPLAQIVTLDLVTGIVRSAQGRFDEAAALMRRAAEAAGAAGDREIEAECYRELSSVEEARGDAPAALVAFRRYHETWAALRAEQAARRLRALQVSLRVEEAEQRSDAAEATTRRLEEDVDRAREQLALAERRLRVEQARSDLAEQRTSGRTLVEQATGLPGPEQAVDFVGRDPERPVGVVIVHVDHRSLGDRPSDPAAIALAADDLAVVVLDVDAAELAAHAERIAAVLDQPFDDVHLEVHIGTALGPEDGIGLNVLLSRARMAVEAARRRSNEQVVAFTAEAESEHRLRRFVSEHLRSALASGDVRVRFQPIVTMAGDVIVGAEALVRWTDPERGPIPTQLFVSMAEELGLIVDLGVHVLIEACKQAATWPVGASGRAPYVSVNASPQQLVNGQLLDHVDVALRASGLAADRLVVELTESRHVDLTRARDTLDALRLRGVKIRIDDFGMGYSNFGYLATLPVDGIKLDRSFIVNTSTPEGVAVTAAMAAMARGLRLGVVAEGVETEVQRAVLLAQGIEHYQGWLFACDLGGEEFAALVQSQAVVAA
jgi:EAL domain-containing protein (putative c-di-GMP-specific phosphodiesterase class I)